MGNKNQSNAKWKREIVQSALTWGHVITLSVLILAALVCAGGLIATVVKGEAAEQIVDYISAWQGFFVAGILGYDAKTTVENALKITQSIKSMQAELKKEETSSETDVSNG